jgi:multiple sugar transport system permease protein
VSARKIASRRLGTPGAERASFPATAILLLIGLLFMMPLVITLANSFMAETEIKLAYSTQLSVFDLIDGVVEKFRQFRLVPRQISIEQYAQVLVRQPSFLTLMLNSVKIAAPVTIGSLFVSMLAGYGFFIWKWRFKEAVFAVFVVVMLMPLQATLVPNYIIADILGIRHSYLAIILPGIFAPFGTFLARQGMKATPLSCLEAARIDGSSELGLFVKIVLPQQKSTVAALCMLVFVEYWNLVDQAVVFITDYTREPLSVYLSRIAEGRIGLVFAASVIYMALPLWFLTLGQKDLQKGIELSGVK